MQPIATIGIDIDHFHVLRSFAVILYQKKGGGKLGFFSKFIRNPEYYVINILI